jgi:Protein of unknown function (DUF3309)
LGGVLADGIERLSSAGAFLIIPFHIRPLQQRDESPKAKASRQQMEQSALLAHEEKMLRTILLIVLFLLLLGALPTWPYSTGWGYYPSGGLGLVLLIILVLIIAKKI